MIGEVSLTIFQYVLLKKFFALMAKMNTSIINANVSVFKANDLIVDNLN